mmetsp:Transcript_51572/g.122684  ORF Transcript_51572/g.122684 Transcript_51572/m.122684 type:complete len:94 (-) Transcript_51572:29-310(-)
MGSMLGSSNTLDGVCLCGRWRFEDGTTQERDILWFGSGERSEKVRPGTPAALAAGKLQNGKEGMQNTGNEGTESTSTSATPSGWWWDSFIDRG